MIKQKGCISSQQSPVFLPYEHKYRKSLFSSMFLEDFSEGFCYAFAPVNRNDEFYSVTPENDTLMELLQSSHYRSDFDCEFEGLINKIVHYMLINGRTYLEIVSFTDQQNIIRGIDFVCIPTRHPRAHRDKYRFTVQDCDKKKVRFDVDRKRIVTFDLKDIGFQRNYFRKVINRLSVFDTENYLKLSTNPKMKEMFDNDEYQKMRDYKLLGNTRHIYWLGRHYLNQYLSESYQLYRMMQFKTLRYKFLQYVLSQINGGLNIFKNEWDFSGNISISIPLPHYQKIYSQYNSGEVNTSTLFKIVMDNSFPKEIEL